MGALGTGGAPPLPSTPIGGRHDVVLVTNLRNGHLVPSIEREIVSMIFFSLWLSCPGDHKGRTLTAVVRCHRALMVTTRMM